MLIINVSLKESYDEVNNEFVVDDEVILKLEHSLLAMSKWEAFYNKPFLSIGSKTPEEMISYIEMMVVSNNFSKDTLTRLSQEQFQKINEYITSLQSATTFNNVQKPSGRQEIITTELIYYWMSSFNIPFECENWHLNRLFSLIQIYLIKSSKQKNTPNADAIAQRRSLNEQRRAQLGSNG